MDKKEVVGAFIFLIFILLFLSFFGLVVIQDNNLFIFNFRV